jgi:hypothetical protein
VNVERLYDLAESFEQIKLELIAYLEERSLDRTQAD